MSDIEAADSEFDDLVRHLYSKAANQTWTEFRSWGLDELRRWTGAEGAFWVTLSHGTVIGERTATTDDFAIPLDAVMSLTRGSGPGFRVSDSVPANLCPAALPAPARLYSQRYAHRHAGGLESILLFYFSGDGVPKSTLARAAAHLVEAGSLALLQYIQRDEWLMALGRSNRGSAAVVDGGGAIYAASQRFLKLVIGPGGEAMHELPFELPASVLEGDREFIQGPLHFRVSPVGALYQLHARKPLPLDGLSPREQQIARALGSGKTFKSVARQYDIAVSTVANHASRIYRKLGIYRREDLVEMVRKPTSNGAATG
jgi:DNA-binding CsgD family transcriptional regulator